MGLAASTTAFSSLTAERATGMCCDIHTGSVVWIWPFSSHASELAKSLLQESVGVRQLCAAPRRTQLALKWLLTDVQEGGNNGQCWVSIASAVAWALRTLWPLRVGGDITSIPHGSEARHTGRCRWHTGSPVLLQLARPALQTNTNFSEFVSKTPGSLLILTNQLLTNLTSFLNNLV